MRNKLKDFLFEDEAIEEVLSISSAPLVSSTQIVGGPMLPIGMKPSKNIRRGKRKRLISASPAVHDPDALALRSESFGAMHEPDFKGPAMPGLWQGLEDPDKPVKTASPALHKKKKRKL